MQVQNTLTKDTKPKFSVAIQGDTYKKLINNTLSDPKRAQRFIASVSSAVATNKALQACEAGSILSAALLGEALNLSPSPQLGQFYMVPYKEKDKDGNLVKVNAQFQLGYKGYIQLALRSGYYRKLNADVVKEGELIRFDPVEETIEIQPIEDELERECARTVGYYAMFEYLNGFKKVIYWSIEKMQSHADRYSQAYSLKNHQLLLDGKVAQKDMWKYSSFWYKSFDDMALKTMLRQLISKWGIMSIELQNAIEGDDAVFHADGSKDYVDSADNEFQPSAEPEEAAEEAEETDGDFPVSEQDDFFNGQ